jgi:hypothetical protein
VGAIFLRSPDLLIRRPSQSFGKRFLGYKMGCKCVMAAQTSPILTRTESQVHQMDENERRQTLERMEQQARDYIHLTRDFRTADDLAKSFGKGSRWIEQLETWKQNREVFAIEDEGQELFPVYAFDPSRGFRPYWALTEVLGIFGNHWSAWAIAFWFAGVNGYLRGQCPKDLLPSDPMLVVQSAQYEANGIQHG